MSNGRLSPNLRPPPTTSEPPHDSPPHALRGAAVRHHRAGELDEAATVLHRLLTYTPQETRALLLLALVRDGQDDLTAADALYRRYLQQHPGDGFALHHLGLVHQRLGNDADACSFFAQAVTVQPDHAQAFNDFAAALYRLGETERALAAFDRAIALDPANATARCNRGKLLAAMHRLEAAAAAFRSVLGLVPRSASDWHDRGVACLHLGDLAAAEASCRRAMACDEAGSEAAGLEARLLLADILERSRRTDEARHERSEVGRRQDVVTRRCLGKAAEARILLVGGAGLCNLPTDFLVDRTRFDRVTLFLPPVDEPASNAAAQIADLPHFDVAFNIVGDADAGAPFIGRVEKLLRRLPCPVINPPSRIPPTRRDRLAALLADISGFVIPTMIRLASGANTGQDKLTTPLLVRPTGSHGGSDLVRVETRSQLADVIATAPAAENHYVSEYCDYRSPDGWFRKYRLVFVGGEVFPVHLAIGADWLVHYWRANMAEWMQREEAAFLADHRSVFPGAAGNALQSVAQRLGLDFAGIDCAMLQDGRLLLFEANATMLVHTVGAFAAKRDQAARIRDAMTRRILQVARQDGRQASAKAVA